ncbi:class I SAM-dependent methyltransferase [Methylocystis sp. H62]|uniref:methyltransferase regulatory domain-containing protein n=1 Tax=Methylocystis sp. H62 TaxID=2785789 RepID=UPI0018C32214|nr:methyltransferase regulatory domain-containing protein [Methylocystis sp. H62]MBG0795055.1 class I SAM-dependent methyltransferase [Methylocystis sp. H62]
MTTHFGTAVQAAIARNAASYDDLPYVSHPFPQTHPARLGAIARIFKLQAADLSRARVLELGCAAGGNLIPLAARHPDAYFLGVDLSQRQIDEGQQRVAALGLSNINLRRQSLTDLRSKDGGFDYIICHGVYSWVPEQVRDAILRIARENLTPNGVAFISYNVQPGWRLRQTLRDALALHVGPHGSLSERVARAREMLSFLEQNTLEDTTWGRIFRAEAAHLRTTDDSYIGHEFLEDCNEPCSFSEFMTSAGGRGLAYLGEAGLSTMMPENMNPAAAPLLRALAGENQVSLEQHMDIFTGRTFRQTLLIHKEREGKCVRKLMPEALEGLHFLARPDFGFSREQDGKAIFADTAGSWFSTPEADVRKAIEALVARLPDSSSIDEIVAAMEVRGASVDGAMRTKLADALLRMALVGLLTPSTEPVRIARSLSAKPMACPMLRADAAAGVLHSANLRHEPIRLDIVAQVVTPLLDGSNDRDGLIAATIAAADAGRVTFQRAGQTVEEPADIAVCAAEHVDRVLGHLQSNACLVA